MTKEQFQQMLAHLRAIAGAGHSLADLSLMDKMLLIVLQREMPSEVRAEWYAALQENPAYGAILEKRCHMEPERLAKEMGISLPELYFLEREMYNLYYPISRKYRKEK